MDHQTTICVDLDGVIYEYDVWKGSYHFGNVMDGAKECLEELREDGWRIIIYTTRGLESVVKGQLDEDNIPFDYINYNPDQPKTASDKPIADIYLDDRAIRFDNWDEAIVKIIANDPREDRKDISYPEAWWFLQEHKVFKPTEFLEKPGSVHVYYRYIKDLNQLISIMVVRVDPKTNEVSDDESKNTKPRVWLETDVWDSDNNMYAHDIDLDVEATTFEEAIIKLAIKVKKKYGGSFSKFDRGKHRWEQNEQK